MRTTFLLFLALAPIFWLSPLSANLYALAQAEPHASASEQREIADLAAQESMATSTAEIVELTDKIVFLTALQIALSAAGTAAVAIALYLNAVSTKASVQLALAERAWLVYGGNDRLSGDPNFMGIQQPNCIGTKFIIANQGRNPAIRVQVYCNIKVVDAGGDIPHFKPPRDEKLGGQSFGPGVRGESKMLWLNSEDSQKLRDEQVDAYAYLFIRYLDISTPKIVRTTEYCCEMSINGMISNGAGEFIENTEFFAAGDQLKFT